MGLIKQQEIGCFSSANCQTQHEEYMLDDPTRHASVLC